MCAQSFPIEILVAEAIKGSESAWKALVDRYAPLVWSICRSFRLTADDAADVSQTVWLRTVEFLPALRNPSAMPGWLTTTTRNECLRTIGTRARTPCHLSDAGLERALGLDAEEVDAELLAAERRAMVREAFAQLPAHCQELLSLLMSPEHPPYQAISAELDLPVGSIGPMRSRCLDKLHSCPALQRWLADPERESEQRV